MSKRASTSLDDEELYGLREEGEFRYGIYNGGAIITDLDADVTGALVIPHKLGGFPVTGIEDDLLRLCKGVTSVTLPKSFNKAPSWIFDCCEDLTDIHVERGNKSFSDVDGVLYDARKKELICIPLAKKGVCSIPASVEEFHSGAFGDCRFLTAVEVEVRNREYRSFDGMVFTKDLSEPVLCPAGREKVLMIPRQMTSWSDCAFFWCDKIPEVRVDEGNPSFRSCEGVLYTKDLSKLVWCPRGKCGTCMLPAEVVAIEDKTITGCGGITAFAVAAENPAFCELDGVLFSKDKTRLICFTRGKCGGVCRLPAEVTEIADDAFSYRRHPDAFEVDTANLSFCTHDGVLLNKAKTRIVRCPRGKTGDFRIPESVTTVDRFAFIGNNTLKRLIVPTNESQAHFSSFGEFMGEVVYT